MIPILDLRIQYASLRAELDEAMQRVAASGTYILGPEVAAFEEAVAAFLGCRRAVGVANGTDALHLALRALRVGPGDEVITTPFTFIATTEAISIVGATPVFADVRLDTFNIDPAAIEKALSPRTKAIIPVHLFGQPCEMEPIMSLARARGLCVIEDCAQAFGATYHDQAIGTFGDAGCLSFFPSKNLGCFGDGGMVVTNNEELASRIEMLRRHGGLRKYHHTEVGLNSRLDELQAAILRVKLKSLGQWNTARRERAALYRELLGNVANLNLPCEMPNVTSVYHQYTIRLQFRDTCQAALKARGVQTAVYYPLPLHLQEVHASLGCKMGSFPLAEKAAATCLSLPMYPELAEDDQRMVARSLIEFLG